MAKYLYTAFLEPEGNAFNVTFPDLEECYTCGDDLPDALKMAEDALASYLTWQEDHGHRIPPASNPGSVIPPNGSISTLIQADTELYRRLLSQENTVYSRMDG